MPVEVYREGAVDVVLEQDPVSVALVPGVGVGVGGVPEGEEAPVPA